MDLWGFVVAQSCTTERNFLFKASTLFKTAETSTLGLVFVVFTDIKGELDRLLHVKVRLPFAGKEDKQCFVDFKSGCLHLCCRII